MKILITGVHGFVGSNLVAALSQEHTIYGLDIISPIKEGVRFTFAWEYLDKPGEIPEVDAIIHLAGKAHSTGLWHSQNARNSCFLVRQRLQQIGLMEC